MAVNRLAISGKGISVFKNRELSPTASDTWVNQGILESMTLTDTPDDVDVNDAQGYVVTTVQGNEKISAVVVLKQTSKTEIDYARAIRGKYYDMVAHIPLEGSSWQHIRMFGKITSAIELNFVAGKERTIKLTCKLLAPKAAFSGTPAGLSYTKNVPYVVLDDTTESQDPSDTAANVAAAIL